MNDFTPGPWRVEEVPYRHIRSDNGCVWANDYKPDANARLIAAAPDLLEVAKAIDGMWSDDGDGGRVDPIDVRSGQVREIWQNLRAAIAKALGKEEV